MEIDSDINFYHISADALRDDTLQKLSCMLNEQKVLLSPKPLQLPRDYRGLGDLMGIGITNWAPQNDKVKMLLKLWRKQKPDQANLGKLQEFFGLIDRFDVLDDTHEMFVEDARNYKLERVYDTVDCYLPDSHDLAKAVYTIGDVERINNGLPPQIYDAFLLYVRADEEFAKLLITTLEGPEYNLKLCDKNRDFVGGIQIENVAIIKMISQRCRNLLVVLSPEFLQSESIQFVHLTQSMNDKRVVPCIYKDIPKHDDNFFNTCHVLDHRRSNGLVNFWKKLHSSLVPLVPENSIRPTVPITSLQNDVHSEIVSESYCTESPSSSRKDPSATYRVEPTAPSSDLLNSVYGAPDEGRFLDKCESKTSSRSVVAKIFSRKKKKRVKELSF